MPARASSESVPLGFCREVRGGFESGMRLFLFQPHGQRTALTVGHGSGGYPFRSGLIFRYSVLIRASVLDCVRLSDW